MEELNEWVIPEWVIVFTIVMIVVGIVSIYYLSMKLLALVLQWFDRRAVKKLYDKKERSNGKSGARGKF